MTTNATNPLTDGSASDPVLIRKLPLRDAPLGIAPASGGNISVGVLRKRVSLAEQSTSASDGIAIAVGMGSGVDVRGIAAGRVVTRMAANSTRRQIPVHKLVRDAMRGLRSPFIAQSAVTLGVASPLPFPTVIRPTNVNVGPESAMGDVISRGSTAFLRAVDAAVTRWSLSDERRLAMVTNQRTGRSHSVLL